MNKSIYPDNLNVSGWNRAYKKAYKEVYGQPFRAFLIFLKKNKYGLGTKIYTEQQALDLLADIQSKVSKLRKIKNESTPNNPLD